MYFFKIKLSYHTIPYHTIQALIELPPKISHSRFVIDFLDATQHDIHPPHSHDDGNDDDDDDGEDDDHKISIIDRVTGKQLEKKKKEIKIGEG